MPKILKEGILSRFGTPVPTPEPTPVPTNTKVVVATKSSKILSAPILKQFVEPTAAPTPTPTKGIAQKVTEKVGEILKPAPTLPQVSIKPEQLTGKIPEKTQEVLKGFAPTEVAAPSAQFTPEGQIAADKFWAAPIDTALAKTREVLAPHRGVLKVLTGAQNIIENFEYKDPITGKIIPVGLKKNPLHRGIVQGVGKLLMGSSKDVDEALNRQLPHTITNEDKVLTTVGEVVGQVATYIAGGAILKGLGFAKATLPVLFAALGQTSAPPETEIQQRIEKLPLDAIAGFLFSKIPAFKNGGLSASNLKALGLGTAGVAGIGGGQGFLDSLIMGKTTEEAFKIAQTQALMMALFHVVGSSVGLLSDEILTSKVKTAQGDFTPQEIKTVVRSTKLEGTQMGNDLMKLADEAEKTDKNINIDMTAVRRSLVSKKLDLNKPEGLGFNAKLVDKAPGTTTGKEIVPGAKQITAGAAPSKITTIPPAIITPPTAQPPAVPPTEIKPGANQTGTELTKIIQEEVAKGNTEFITQLQEKVAGNTKLEKIVNDAIVSVGGEPAAKLTPLATLTNTAQKTKTLKEFTNLLKATGKRTLSGNEKLSVVLGKPVTIADITKNTLQLKKLGITVTKDATGEVDVVKLDKVLTRYLTQRPKILANFYNKANQKVSKAITTEKQPSKVTTAVSEAEKVSKMAQISPKAAKKAITHRVKVIKATATGQVEPNFYRQNKTDLYNAAMKKDRGELLTNEETLSVVRKYIGETEVPVHFLDTIPTLDGGTAWGRSAYGMIQFVNNPKMETPTHEVVHTFLDLFVTPEQKQLYIGRKLQELKETATPEKFNEQVRLAQEHTKNPTTGIMVSMEKAERIYAGEELADDFLKYVQDREKKSLFQRLWDKLIRFIRKFKDPNNIKNLYQDIADRVRSKVRTRAKEAQNYFLTQEDKFAVSTRTLNRMRRELTKEFTSRQNIESYARRENLTKADIDLFNETLNEFTGDKINVAEFISKMQSKIMPIALVRAYNHQDYADWGYDHLTNLHEGIEGGGLNYKDNFIPETHIWDTPYKHGQPGHFRDVYATKKIEYKIQKVTDQATGKEWYAVIEKDVIPTQENIMQITAGLGNTMGEAQDLIKDLSARTGMGTSGLLGHTRVGTGKTPESLKKEFGTQLTALDERLTTVNHKVKLAKDLHAYFNKNQRVLTNRINEFLDKTVKKLEKENPGSNYGGFSIEFITARLFGNGNNHYLSDDQRLEWYNAITKGLNAPALTAPETEMAHDVMNLLYTKTSKFLQRQIMKAVNGGTLAIHNKNDVKAARENILERKVKLEEELKRSLEKPMGDKPVRVMLEIQSDPFQSRYTVVTDYMKAKDEVKKWEEIIRDEPTTDPEVTKDRENRLKLAKEELALREKERTPIEKQFFIVGNKYHERAIKEEIRLAAQDMLQNGKTEALFRLVTPVTNAFNEGAISPRDFKVMNGSLVKRDTKIIDILKEKKASEMPPRPIAPIPELGTDERAIFVNDPMMADLHQNDFITIDGELFEVANISTDGRIAYLRPVSEDYHENYFDDIHEPRELDQNEDFDYGGDTYTVLEVDGSTLTAAKADRVRQIDIEEEISSAVDSRMDDVQYEIRELGKKYFENGVIDTAKKAQEMLDLVGKEPQKGLFAGVERPKITDFDTYETQTVLEDMAASDKEGELDPTDFEERAREDLYQSEGDMINDEGYWTDMGYEKAYRLNDNEMLVVEEGGEIITLDTPDSESNVFPKYQLDEDEVTSLEALALSASGKSTETYDQEMKIYNEKIAALDEKYRLLEEEMKTKVPPPNLQNDGTYTFDKTNISSEDARTVFKYYEEQVVPYFKKYRKDAKVITDENGMQWWETTITEADKEPVEVYMRKTDYETVVQIARKLQKPVEETKPSKVGVSIEAKAIEEGLAKSFAGTAEYTPVTIKEQAAMAAKLINSSPTKAKNIVLGLEPLPLGLRAGTILKAMEDMALDNGDSELLRQIANSPLTAETSLHAQELRMLAERNPESPVKIIQDVQAIKKKAVESKTGKKVKEAVKKEVQKIKKEVKVPDKNDWNKFLDTIKCNY
jgi:hypothetical protein